MFIGPCIICNSWRMKDQLDVTCYFISLLMCSTCFGHKKWNKIASDIQLVFHSSTILTLVTNRTSVVKKFLYWVAVTLYACDTYWDWVDVSVVDRYGLEKEGTRSVSGKDTNFVFAITCRPPLGHRAAHRLRGYWILSALLCSVWLRHSSNFVFFLCLSKTM